MLPRVARHHVEEMAAQRAAVVQITLQRLVAAQVRVILVRARAGLRRVVQRLLRALRHIHRAAAGREVQTRVYVQAQPLYAMHLIVQLRVADEAPGRGTVVLLVEQRHGVRCSHGVAVAVQVAPHVVAVVAPLRVIIHRLRGVHVDGLPYGILIGKAVVRHHPLGIEAHGEVPVEQLRREVDRQRTAVHLRRAQHPLLAEVAARHAVRHAARFAQRKLAVQADVALVGRCQPVNLFLPVGIGITQCTACIRVTSRIVGYCPAQRGGIHYIHIAAHLAERSSKVHTDLRQQAAALATLPGGDDNDAVRRTRTVDGRSRSILQHGETLYIARVDAGKRVAHAADALVADGQPVYHDERIVGGRERRTPADADGGSCPRLTAALGNDYTG